jgi:hypothetical protein
METPAEASSRGRVDEEATHKFEHQLTSLSGSLIEAHRQIDGSTFARPSKSTINVTKLLIAFRIRPVISDVFY